MGVERTVTTPRPVEWPQLRDWLAARGYRIDLRMIDGELSFPDEEPPAGWCELRAGTAGGMITLRRTPAGLTCVTWGNADENLRRAWNALALAAASVAGGTIDADGTRHTADEFAAVAELPDALRGGGPAASG